LSQNITSPANSTDPNHVGKGIIALVMATLFFAAQDAITKHLTESISVAQIVSVRFFFFSLFAFILAVRKIGIKSVFHSSRPKSQIVRGLLISSEIALFAYALHFLGLAEMHAIFACFPLIITALSVPFLGESVGWRRWLAVGLGFIGTLIIIRPDTGAFSPYALITLLCAFMFAGYNLITRKVSRHDRFETSLLYFGVVGFVASLTVVPFYWQSPNSDQVFWLIVISITGIFGHLLLIKALQLAPAVILQPFNYFILLWAMIIGYSVYGEVLETYKLVGAALVVGSGVYIARREFIVARTERKRLRRAMYPPEV
jgi:drug/metabolite transporter (DMT)-like permease